MSRPRAPRHSVVRTDDQTCFACVTLSDQMFSADTLTFQEFMKHELLPLATIQNAVLEFIRGRKNVVLFGAQAVNAYVSEPRMTQDVDLFSNRAPRT